MVHSLEVIQLHFQLLYISGSIANENGPRKRPVVEYNIACVQAGAPSMSLSFPCPLIRNTITAATMQAAPIIIDEAV